MTILIELFLFFSSIHFVGNIRSNVIRRFDVFNIIIKNENSLNVKCSQISMRFSQASRQPQVNKVSIYILSIYKHNKQFNEHIKPLLDVSLTTRVLNHPVLNLSCNVLKKRHCYVDIFFIIFLRCSSPDQQSHLHINLVATLAMAQIIFLTGINATYNQVIFLANLIFLHDRCGNISFFLGELY